MRTTANTPVPHLGHAGARTVEAHAHHLTTRVNATQELVGALAGGPGYFAGNLAQRERNDPGYPVAGSHLGQHVTAYPEEGELELAWHQSPLTVTGNLSAKAGAKVTRKGGAVLRVERHHFGRGVIDDHAALIRLHDESRADGNLIEDNYAMFVVDKDRQLRCPMVVTDALFVAGLPVVGGGAATTDFQDDAFTLYDGLDATKVAQFVCNTIATGTTRTFTFPNASGTLALTSDLAGQDHGALTGLADDDHTQYAKLAGRASAQTQEGEFEFLAATDGTEVLKLRVPVATTGAEADGLFIDREMAAGATGDAIMARLRLADSGGTVDNSATLGARWIVATSGSEVCSFFVDVMDGSGGNARGLDVHPSLGGSTSYPGASVFGSYLLVGSGDPENNATAPVGSLYMRTDGGAGTSLYVKESGSGNTGWVGK